MTATMLDLVVDEPEPGPGSRPGGPGRAGRTHRRQRAADRGVVALPGCGRAADQRRPQIAVASGGSRHAGRAARCTGDLSAGIGLFSVLASCVPLVAAAFNSGAVAAEQYPDGLAASMQSMSEGWTAGALPELWVPAIEGLAGRLTAGGRVAELGCGAGHALQALGRRYPGLTGEGFELDARQVEQGNRRLVAAGLADRVRLQAVDAVAGLRGPYDLVLALSVLHDIGDLDSTLRVIADCLAPQGHLLVVESPPLRGPLAAMLLATSTLYCVPSVQARGQQALGTLGLPPEVLDPGGRPGRPGAGSAVAAGHPTGAGVLVRPEPVGGSHVRDQAGGDHRPAATAGELVAADGPGVRAADQAERLRAGTRPALPRRPGPPGPGAGADPADPPGGPADRAARRDLREVRAAGCQPGRSVAGTRDHRARRAVGQRHPDDQPRVRPAVAGGRGAPAAAGRAEPHRPVPG